MCFLYTLAREREIARVITPQELRNRATHIRRAAHLANWQFYNGVFVKTSKKKLWKCLYMKKL